MVKTITIQIPDWMDEEKLRKAILQAVSQATKELSIEEVRKMLGIKPEDLTEELEVEDVEELRKREKGRLKWLY
jgi:DNA-binding transcriptional regulator YiaG